MRVEYLYPTKIFDTSIVSEIPLLEMSDSRIRPTAKNRSRRIETRSVGFAHESTPKFQTTSLPNIIVSKAHATMHTDEAKVV